MIGYLVDNKQKRKHRSYDFYIFIVIDFLLVGFLFNSEEDDIIATPTSIKNDHQSNSSSNNSNILSHNGSYKGTPWQNDRTVSVQTVAETKFARCDVHTVLSEDGKSKINDWIFMEEMDAVNVIVMNAHEQKFVVFKQGKYAIPGETYSPVGGFIDKGEAPYESARREVMEELGMGSKRTLDALNNAVASNAATNVKDAFTVIPKAQRSVDNFGLAEGKVDEDDKDWVFLGRYRTAANRGGGFIYTYLLKNALPILEGGGTVNFKITGDDESQEIHFLTLGQTKSLLMNGQFQEVKWAATIALALLHLKSDCDQFCESESTT